jgi:iron(III) transport system permease protein
MFSKRKLMRDRCLSAVSACQFLQSAIALRAPIGIAIEMQERQRTLTFTTPLIDNPVLTLRITNLSLRRAATALGLYSVAALVALPLLTVLMSFVFGRPGTLTALWETVLPLYATNTLGLMVLTGLIALILGVGSAWCVAMLDFPGRRYLSWMLILPLAAPAYILAYVYVDLLDYYGPVQSALRGFVGRDGGPALIPNLRHLPGAALILGLTLYPYIYLLARTAFQKQSTHHWHAARSLGLAPFAAFRRVSLPMARPAIIGGLALVLMETLADFGVADYFGVPTFSVGIFRSWLAGGDTAQALRLAAIMLIFVLVLLGLEAASRKGETTQTGPGRDRIGRISLSPLRGWIVFGLCLAPVLLGFIIPFARLLWNLVTVPDAGPGLDFFVYAKNTVLLGVIVGGLALIIALSLAYANRAQPSRMARATLRFSTLGYALPGALLAIGLLIPIGALDRSLTRAAVDLFGWSGGLILTGSLAVLVFALLIRFLTVSYNTLNSGFAALPPNIDAAARSLGAKPLTLIWRVHVPLLRSSLGVGWLLVFVDTLRELPATLILRPFNFDTLATRVYWLASDERVAEASTAAVMIIVCGLIPVMLINRSFDSKKSRGP